MSPVKNLIKWYPKYGLLSIYFIVLIQGIKHILTRKSNKHLSGWHPPLANELTKITHGQSYRTVDMSQPLVLRLGNDQKSIQFDEDIYPLA